MTEGHQEHAPLSASLDDVFRFVNGASDTPRAEAANNISNAEAIPVKQVKPQTRIKQVVTPHYLQQLILESLQQIEAFPHEGLSITVYGLRPWNAMIMFAPGSIASKRAIIYRKILPKLVEQLREQFDIE